MTSLKLLLPVAVIIVLGSCGAVKVQDYANNRPTLVMENFFAGDLTADGVVKNWRGRVIRSFTVDIAAYWNEQGGTLEEDFEFDDGEKQRRVWSLERRGEGTYVGTAGDVVGEANVEVSGNSTFLKYVLRIPYGDGSIDVRVDDRMYLISESTLINESKMSKFGIGVGSILLVIDKI